MSHGPRYLPSMSKDRVAGLCFGATFAIAASHWACSSSRIGSGSGTIPVPSNHPTPSGSGGSSATSPPKPTCSWWRPRSVSPGGPIETVRSGGWPGSMR